MTSIYFPTHLAVLQAMIKRAKVFLNGGSQAVRLPKEFRFAGTEVLVEKRGNSVVLTPIEGRWARVVRELPRLEAGEADAIASVVAANRKRRAKPKAFGL